eukprot:s7347_g1.t1
MFRQGQIGRSSLQRQMDVVVGLCTSLSTDQAALSRTLQNIDEKLSRLTEQKAHAPRNKAVSMIANAVSRASLPLSLTSPVQSRGLSAFKDFKDGLGGGLSSNLRSEFCVVLV